MFQLVVFVIATLAFRTFGLLGLSYFDDWSIALKFGFAVILFLMATAHWNLRSIDFMSEVHPTHTKFATIIILTGWIEFVLAILIAFPLTTNVASILVAFWLLVMIPARLYAINKDFFLNSKNRCNTDYKPYVLHVVLIMITFLTGIFPTGQ